MLVTLVILIMLNIGVKNVKIIRRGIMKAKYFVSVLKILKDKYGFNFNINDTMQQAQDKIDELNTFKDIPTTNGSHLAANVIDFLKERDQKKRGDK